MDINSLMRLEDCHLTTLEIRQDPSFPSLPRRKGGSKKVENKVTLKFRSTVMTHKSKRLFWVTLGIDASWPDNPERRFQSVSATVEGKFCFPDETSEEKVRKYVPLLCLTNLYGLARGMIAQATGSCRGGAFFLPLVNMNEVMKNLASGAADPKAPSDQSGQSRSLSDRQERMN